MKAAIDITHIHDFLLCETPRAWIDWALQNQDLMLMDHANCEKKAAATALNLTYRYVEYDALLHMLSRLAREELRHFEQVITLMKARGIRYIQLSASRYAGDLRLLVRKNEPGRLIDTLLIGAIIEARSCERFATLVPVLDEELAAFYNSLLKSESRHYLGYLKFARRLGSKDEVESRLPAMLERERELVQRQDTEFRFHCGVPEMIEPS